jgi:hypothetical protein
VFIRSDFAVTDIQDVVRADNPDKLLTINSCELLVFKNQAAFDKRNDEHGEEKPLDPDQPLHFLGSQEDMLVVLAPELSMVQQLQLGLLTNQREMHDLSIPDLKMNMTAPSSFGHYREKGSWVQVLSKNPGTIICHRDISEDSSIPVCLMNPVFAEFVHDLKHIEVSSTDYAFVDALTRSMCEAFHLEGDRVKAFHSLFNQYIGRYLSTIMIKSSVTDGSFTWGNGALYCNLEVKVEKGSGRGDPYMQNIAFYINSLPDSTSASNQYPCFLLELCGTAFSVSGILNTNHHIVCDPLSPTYQLLCYQEFNMFLAITKLFASLRKALINLGPIEFNKGFLPISSFPYPSSFSDRRSGSQFQIQYLKKMKKLLFSAKILNSDMRVIVKFCSRYNQDVHLFCHSCGFAPALISCTAVGNYIVVVMEKLVLRDLRNDELKNPEIQQQIRYMASRLKEKSFVHGDMRLSNILFDTCSKRVVLVDYDWSGIDGKDTYPPLMNPSIRWPKGASTGQPLRHEHDLYWLKNEAALVD